MSLILRAFGLLFLAGAGIAGLSWLNTDKIMNPVIKEVVISSSKITTLMFTSNKEISSRDYVGRLYFNNTPKSSVTCEDVQHLGIQWVIGTSETVQSWNTLESKNSDCQFRSDIDLVVVRFSAPSFKPNINYYFHLSKNNKTQNSSQIKVNAAIQHADGIGTHYLFMDKALSELIGGGLLLVSSICFVADLLTFLFRFRSPKSD